MRLEQLASWPSQLVDETNVDVELGWPAARVIFRCCHEVERSHFKFDRLCRLRRFSQREDERAVQHDRPQDDCPDPTNYRPRLSPSRLFGLLAISGFRRLQISHSWGPSTVAARFLCRA